MKEDCMECYYNRPGTGCVSEAEMACGCCYIKISPQERIEQIAKIMQACVDMLNYVKLKRKVKKA